MKKMMMAVMMVAAGGSFAGAQERGVNFDGGPGAGVPMPKMERVQAVEAAQQALAGAAAPQRMIILGKVDKESLGKLLQAAGRSRTRSTEHCYPGGVEVMGNMACMMKCCDVDLDGDDIPNTTYCEPEMDSCRPVEPEADKSWDKTEDKAAIKAKALQFADLLKSLRNKKKTRGPYEDCVNYCIDEYLGCSGDADPKPCNDRYSRCINVCDGVVNKP